MVNIFVLASKKYINLEHSTFLAMKNSKNNIKIVNRNFEITLKHHMLEFTCKIKIITHKSINLELAYTRVIPLENNNKKEIPKPVIWNHIQ